MVAFKCPMCTSGDCGKIDDYFVCNHCGTKFTNETVTRLVHEGKVDITGSVVKVEGIDDYHTELKRGYTHLLTNNLSSAKNIFEQMIEKYPEKKEVYKGSVVAETNFFEYISLDYSEIDGEKIAIGFSRNIGIEKINNTFSKMKTISNVYKNDEKGVFDNFDNCIANLNDLYKKVLSINHMKNINLEKPKLETSEEYKKAKDNFESCLFILILSGIILLIGIINNISNLENAKYLLLIIFGVFVTLFILMVKFYNKKKRLKNNGDKDFLIKYNNFMNVKDALKNKSIEIENIYKELKKEAASLRENFNRNMGNI